MTFTVVAAGGTFNSAKLTDKSFDSNSANDNYPAESITASSSGSKEGNTVTRSLLAFDLSALPSNAEITSAHLVLNNSGESLASCGVKLERVTDAWDNKTVTFNKQPKVSDALSELIEFDFDPAQSVFDIDVTGHMQKMVSSVNSVNGWLLSLQEEGITEDGRFATFAGNTSITSPYVQIQLTMPSFACDDRLLNWNQEETYDEDGIVTHVEKTYMDKLGRRTQKLEKNANNEVYRTEVLYDSYGRPAIASLPAYTGNQLKFQVGFIRNSSGQVYDIQHFDTPFNKLNSPDPLQISVNNTLGNYYSDANTYDPNQATATNPYTRTEYSGDPFSLRRKVSSPGNATKMGTGRENSELTMICGDELSHVYGAHTSYKAKTLTGNKLNCSQLTMNTSLNVVKRISTSPDNLEVITYMEGDRIISSCYSGLSAAEKCTNITGVTSIMDYDGTRSADIHIPDDDKSSVFLPLPVQPTGYPTPGYYINYMIADLNTDYVLIDGVDYTIDGSRNLVFDPAYLSQYTGKSLKLRFSFSYDESYILGLPGSIHPASAEINYNLSYGRVSRNSYDLAGRLRKSTAPKGYDCSPINNFDFYGLFTSYDYSHLGQVVASKKPDEGVTQMVYDKKGNLRFSQNDFQKANGSFSYMKYDQHSRLLESGENLYSPAPGSTYFLNYYSAGAGPLYGGSQSTDDILDVSDGLIAPDKSNVSSTSYVIPVGADNIPAGYTYQAQYQDFRNGQTNFVKNANSITWFNYDGVGRPLATITQVTEPDFVTKNPGIDQQIKTSQQTYNYYTGKVSSSTYQLNNSSEKLYFQYEYDLNQRATTTKLTYGSNSVPQMLGSNFYNKLGSLRRLVIGNDLQGVDYTYLINGSLKAINHAGLTNALDPGHDKGDYTGTDANLPVNKDLFGEILEYYNNDYQRANTNFGNGIEAIDSKYDGMIYASRFKTENDVNGTTTGASYIDYSGWNQQIITLPKYELRFDYAYDEFNRLASSNFSRFDNEQLAITDQYADYQENGGSGNPIAYDKNGNITRLVRQAFNGTTMDDLSYTYGTTAPVNNQLTAVQDAALYNNPSFNFYTSGIAATFDYNNIGQLTASPAEGITDISYFPSGKIKMITYANSNTTEYEYGADGNKIKAKVKKIVSGVPKYKYTWYVGPYTYEYDEHAGTVAFNIKHAAVPGGIIRPSAGGTDITFSYPVFHLTDHLGNVRVTFKPSGTGNGINILSYQDYYAFGGQLPGRKWSAENYDFGLRGQEKSEDGNNWDHFPLREYNHDLGRWFAPDAYGQFSSPYVAFGNNPVNFIDPSGGYTTNSPPPQKSNRDNGPKTTEELNAFFEESGQPWRLPIREKRNPFLNNQKMYTLQYERLRSRYLHTGSDRTAAFNDPYAYETPNDKMKLEYLKAVKELNDFYSGLARYGELTIAMQDGTDDLSQGDWLKYRNEALEARASVPVSEMRAMRSAMMAAEAAKISSEAQMAGYRGLREQAVQDDQTDREITAQFAEQAIIQVCSDPVLEETTQEIASCVPQDVSSYNNESDPHAHGPNPGGVGETAQNGGGSTSGQIMAGALVLGGITSELPPAAGVIVTVGALAAGVVYAYEKIAGKDGFHTTYQPASQNPIHSPRGGADPENPNWIGAAKLAGAAKLIYEIYDNYKDNFNNVNLNRFKPAVRDNTYVSPTIGPANR